MKCPKCQTEHPRGVSYCVNCGCYIPGNAQPTQTATTAFPEPQKTTTPPSKLTKGLPLAIVGMVLLEIASIVLFSMQAVLEDPSPDLGALMPSTAIWLLLSVAALIIGILSIRTYKNAVAMGARKPIPTLVLGIIGTVTGAIFVLLSLFILLLLGTL